MHTKATVRNYAVIWHLDFDIRNSSAESSKTLSADAPRNVLILAATLRVAPLLKFYKLYINKPAD